MRRIVEAIAPVPGQSLVEIGPGLGALTAPLVAAAGRLTAVEIDRDLAQRLRERFSAGQLNLVEADALELDWEALVAALPAPVRVVGNLPYHVSTPLLFRLLPLAHAVFDQHFMLQREVVERMAAEPGGKEYGRLSVMLQFRYRVERLFHVAPGSFSPAPRVQSSIVRMRPLPLEQVPADISLVDFGRVVTAAFSQRRKTLRNALGLLLPQDAIAACGVDPGARAETLEVASFVRLTRAACGRAGAQD